MESRTHYKKCAHPSCGLTNRNKIDNIKFHAFPINDHDRCISWLINSGLDDWVEMPDNELKRKYLCSNHFNRDCYHASGRLRNDAVPKNPCHFMEDSNDSETENCSTVPNQKDLEQKLLETQGQLQQEKNKCKILRLQVRAKSKLINRLKNKLSSGNIDDICLRKAICQRLSGFVLAFVLLVIFKTKQMFTKHEQQLFMTMHYTSPALYKKMRDVLGFYLPHPATIMRWFGKIDIWPGISQTLFNALKLKSSYMEDIDRHCVLIFDEMSIKKCLDFHPKRQMIEGFEDLGSLGRNLAVGTQVLVFMLRGLFINWKQPLAFFILKSTVKKHELTVILNEILDALHETNLKIRAIVSDQASSYQATAAERVSIDSPYFIRNGQKIYYLFDYLHLFKGVRNNLIKYDFSINDSVVSWRDVISLWNLEKDKSTRAAYKLSEKHVRPNCFDKMKCKLALQVFSKRVSAAMFTASVTGSINSDTIQHTAQFFETLNDLFDNLNSRSASDPNPMKCAISNFNHIRENLVNYAESMKNWFIISNNNLKTPPCLLGLQQAVNATVQLWDDLKAEGFTFLMTSRLNSDPIENFFSVLRMHGGSYNRNPSAKAVRLAFRKNMLLNLKGSLHYGNCMPDNDIPLMPGDTIAQSESGTLESDGPLLNIQENIDDEFFDESMEVDNTDELTTSTCSLESCALEYFAGYIAKKCIERSGCCRCCDMFLDNNASFVRNEQTLLFFRAYITDDNLDFGHLSVPSVHFSDIFKMINNTFDLYYPPLRSETFILDKLMSIISRVIEEKYPNWLNQDECATHRKEIIRFTLTVKIHKDTLWLGQQLRFSRNIPKTSSRLSSFKHV